MLSLPVVRSLGIFARPRVGPATKRAAPSTSKGSSYDFILVSSSYPSFIHQIRSFHTSNYVLATHYEILGLNKTATADEIRKAYRTKAKQYHPDLNKDPNAQAKFVAVKEAYECLNDSIRRSHYDATLGGFDPMRNAGTSSRRPGPKAPQWDFRKAEEQMWREYRESRHKTWNATNQRMDEEMRKSDEMEAIRRRIAPIFNILLVLSLAAIGGTALYVQYHERKNSSHIRHFAAPSSSDAEGGQPDTRLYQPLPAEDYPGVYNYNQAPKRFTTRWDEVQEAVRRRDEFYRALLRNDEASATASRWSPPTQ